MPISSPAVSTLRRSTPWTMQNRSADNTTPYTSASLCCNRHASSTHALSSSCVRLQPTSECHQPVQGSGRQRHQSGRQYHQSTLMGSHKLAARVAALQCNICVPGIAQHQYNAKLVYNTIQYIEGIESCFLGELGAACMLPAQHPLSCPITQSCAS